MWLLQTQSDFIRWNIVPIISAGCHLGWGSGPDMSFYRCSFKTIYGFGMKIILQNATLNNDFNMVMDWPSCEICCVYTHPWFKTNKQKKPNVCNDLNFHNCFYGKLVSWWNYTFFFFMLFFFYLLHSQLIN